VQVEMAALGNARTLLPVEYPLSSLTSWSDAASAAAVGYNYPCTAPPVAHQFVYSGGRLASAPHPYSGAVGALVSVPDSACSMYSSWRHHPSSPLSLYRHQSEAEWLLRQSKLESASHPFSQRHQQQQQQRWRMTSDSALPPRLEVATSSSTSSGPLCGLQFGVTSSDSASHDGSPGGSCSGAGLSPVMDAWTTTGRTSVTGVDQYMCRGQGQGLQDVHAAPAHTGHDCVFHTACPSTRPA